MDTEQVTSHGDRPIVELTNKSRAKHWCITINNPSIAERSMFENIKELTTYYIYGEEIGASGTEHLQCYIAFTKQTTLATLKRYWPRAHFEIARGTPAQASDYCKKDGKYVEHGTVPQHQGAKGGEATQVKCTYISNDNNIIYERVIEMHTSVYERFFLPNITECEDQKHDDLEKALRSLKPIENEHDLIQALDDMSSDSDDCILM